MVDFAIANDDTGDVDVDIGIVNDNMGNVEIDFAVFDDTIDKEEACSGYMELKCIVRV